MKRPRLPAAARLLIVAPGTLLLASCPAVVQQNLDLLLAPSALDNALFLPFASGFVQRLLGFFAGL
jgi:hypothetical protein